jgi:hypothetical protein
VFFSLAKREASLANLLGLPKVEALFAPIIFVETRSPFGQSAQLCQRDKGLPKSYFWRIFAP